MKDKLFALGNLIWSGFTDLISGILNLAKTLFTTPKALIVLIVLVAFAYDLVSGGKAGSISFITAKLKEIFEITKDVTWPQIAALGNISILGFLVYEKIKK